MALLYGNMPQMHDVRWEIGTSLHHGRNVRLRPGVAAFQGRQVAPHWIPRGRQCGIIPHCISKVTTERADYASSASDSNVLRLPIKQELTPKDVTDVFDYARNLRQKYDLGRVLGAGSFGVVREAIEKTTGRKYACKTIPKIPKRGHGTPRYLLKLQTEVDAMQQLGPSLDSVYLKDVFEDNENVHLIMELCTGGAILERVKAGKMSERDVAPVIRSVLRFIAQCHARGIIYRDVKPDNFLFLSKDPDSPVRATDFGLSIRLWPNEGKLKSRSGTPVYMAPEVIMQDYAHGADVWSVGMLMYQLLTGSFPFWDNVQNISLQQVWQAILTKKIDFNARALRNAISDEARDLLKRMLERNPDDRISAAEALEHPWVKDVNVPSTMPLDGSVVQRLQRYATYGHLKQLVLRLISSDLSNNTGNNHRDVIANLRDLFRAIDTDSSGGISIQELTAGLQAQGYLINESEVEQLMERIDMNRDGDIVLDEFAASLLDWNKISQDESWTSWVDLAFKRLDADGNGFISLDEIVQQLPFNENRGDDAAAERILEAKRMLREADTNNDGQISKEEFVDLLEEATLPDSLSQYDSRLGHDAVAHKAIHSIDD